MQRELGRPSGGRSIPAHNRLEMVNHLSVQGSSRPAWQHRAKHPKPDPVNFSGKARIEFATWRMFAYLVQKIAQNGLPEFQK
jgi:hypothetical protein